MGIAAVVLCLVLGWQSNNVWTGYKNEKVLLQQEAVEQVMRDTQTTIAKQFEDQKQTLIDLQKQNKDKVTTIIKNNQPIYSNQCLDDAGIKQLQEYKDKSK